MSVTARRGLLWRGRHSVAKNGKVLLFKKQRVLRFVTAPVRDRPLSMNSRFLGLPRRSKGGPSVDNTAIPPRELSDEWLARQEGGPVRDGEVDTAGNAIDTAIFLPTKLYYPFF